MSAEFLSFDEAGGHIVACGARLVVRRAGTSFEPSEWSLVEMERGYSRRRRVCAGGTAELIASDGVPTMLTVSSAMPDDELGWPGWSEERERARKRANDAAAVAAFGVVEKAFEWGTVHSRYDARSGSASITLAFRHPSLWERFLARVRGTDLDRA